MARVRAVLAALARVTRRERTSLASFSTNNLFYTGVALLFMSDRGAFAFSLTIIAVALFFPLTADPMRKIPPERLSLWPLRDRDYWAVRAASVFLNPLSWLVIVLLVWKRVTLGLGGLVAGLFVVGFWAPWRYFDGRRGAWRRLPSFPSRLNQLIRKNLREMLATLDFWAAFVFAVLAACFRAAGRLAPDALLPLTLLVSLLLSTCALSLFGLETEGGLARYRLLPLPGWQILAAKDVVFLLVSLLLMLPLNPLAGSAAALMGLAVGHESSVKRFGGEHRWRFQTSDSFGVSVTQIVLMILAAGAATHWGPLVIGFCVAIYSVSTWRAGIALERRLL